MSSSSQAANESFERVVSRLRNEFQGVKLLAMGQTIYWDEPMKAALRKLLDAHYPEAEMLVGIHDADYFSKSPSDLNLDDAWAILPHNDGTTRDLWVATGEISQLLGSETVPTRETLVRYGVQLDKIARDFAGGRDALIDTVTEAWGWRGLVHVNSGNEVSCCVSLRKALPHLLGLLRWGFDRTLDSLSEADATRGRRIADELIADVQSYADTHPDASITDMFCEHLLSFYRRLMGYAPRNLASTRALDLFRFSRDTAALPRFNILRAFLDPGTRSLCQESYDLAVEGSDTYTLDRFPPGAIPFDLVVPGVGRGTICLREGHVFIDMDTPVSLPTDTPITSPEQLADLVLARFGADAALIGKALTLVLMISGEFIFILHEEASAYVPRCEKMASLMKERGIDPRFCPILRIDYHTWDSLSACDAIFRLPGHMAVAFTQGEATAVEFADSWQAAVRDRTKALERISGLTNADDLLAFLAEQQADAWEPRIAGYREAYAVVRRVSDDAEPLKSESVGLRDLSHRIKQEIQDLEQSKGEHFRTMVKPLRDDLWRMETDGTNSGSEYDALTARLRVEEDRRAQIEARIHRERGEASRAHSRSLELKSRVQALEGGDEVKRARQTLKLMDYEAELARMWIVRDAVLVSKGLGYTDHRPSAWWFLLVDPELRWFNRVAETAEFRFEEIDA